MPNRAVSLLSALGLLFLSPLHLLPTNLALTLLPESAVVGKLQAGEVKQSQRQLAIENLFVRSGCATTEEKVTKSASDIICTLPGETTDSIVVGGHFDFVDDGGGRGIVDDWSGASLLVSLFQTLRQSPRHHTFRFVAFAKEEDGLDGSERFVKNLSAPERSSIKAFVNLECLGLSEPKVWASRANHRLLADLIQVAKAVQVPLQGINMDQIGADDDSHPFLNKRIPVFTVHSITQNTFHVLHSSQDRLAAVNSNFYYDAYRLLSVYLVYLDGAI